MFTSSVEPSDNLQRWLLWNMLLEGLYCNSSVTTSYPSLPFLTWHPFIFRSICLGDDCRHWVLTWGIPDRLLAYRGPWETLALFSFYRQAYWKHRPLEALELKIASSICWRITVRVNGTPNVDALGSLPAYIYTWFDTSPNTQDSTWVLRAPRQPLTACS